MEQEDRPCSSLSDRQSRVTGYHLPSCSIRRRRGDDDTFWVYRVQLERGKQQRWSATFDRWAKGMGDEYLRIGKVSFTAASLGSVLVCAHSPGFEPADFCVDEEDGYIYMIKFNQVTCVLTMFAQKLVIFEKIKLMQLVGAPVYFSSKPLFLYNALKCSHFSISDDDADERRFLLALSICPNPNDASQHRDWLCSLSGLDIKNKSFDYICTMIVNPMNPLCNVFDPTGEVSEWQRVGDKVLGVVACVDPAAYCGSARRELPMKRFLVSFDGKVCDEMHFLLAANSSGDSSHHRLIGLFGKYLLFDVDGSSSVRAVRVLAKLSYLPGNALSIADQQSPYRRLEIDLGQFNPDHFDASQRWFDANRKFYISGFCEKSSTSRLLELSMLENRDIVKLLADSRQCAICGLFEEMKWLRYGSAQRMSSFKVCSICKEKKLHKMWWRFKCHFCSLQCFSIGWKEHKKIH